MISAYVRMSPRYELVISLMISEIQKTRTSGLLVVVGLSSYLAYRLCLKYFGDDYLSALFRCDDTKTPQEDENANSFFQEPYQQREAYDIYADDEWSSDDDFEADLASVDTVETFLPRNELLNGARKPASPCLDSSSASVGNFSPFRQIRLSPPSRNSTPLKKHSCPLFNGSPARRRSLPQSPLCRNKQRQNNNRLASYRTPTLQKFSAQDSDRDTSSDGSYADSPPPIRRRRPQTLPQFPQNSAPPDTQSLISSCPSSATGALEFSWDAICTPASINFDENLQKLLQGNSDTDPESLAQRVLLNLPSRETSKSPAPSEFSCYSELSTGGIQQIGLTTSESLERLQTDISHLKDGLESLKFDVSELLERSHCNTDSKHLYRSVIVAPSDVASEGGSVRSLEIPWFSRENLGDLSIKSQSPEVTRELNGNRELKAIPRVLSGDSYHTHISADHTPSTEGTSKSESSDVRKSQKLFDSAICTDFASSDSNSDSGYMPKSRNFEISLGVTPEEVNMDLDLDVSREISLEWDEMRLRSATGTTESVIADSLSEDLKIEGFANGKNPDCSGSEKLLPPGSRDLMVFAREKYFESPAVMKVLHQLYKKGRFRRTVELRPSLFAPVQACLLSMLHQGIPMFKCNTFTVVTEAVDLSLKRCSFLRNWSLPNEVRKLIGFSNIWNEEIVQSAMQLCLKHLWDLSNCTDLNQVTDKSKGPILLEAVKLLIVLKSLEVYDHTLSLRYPSRAFYAELFLKKTPKNIMEDLRAAGWSRAFTEIELALMAEALGTRLEIFKLATSRPHVAAVYPDKMVAPPGVTILQLDADSSFMPLFRVD